MTTASVFAPEPPLLAAARGVVETLAQVSGYDPTFLSVGVKEALLLELARAARQIEGLLVDTLAVAGDVAEAHACRTPGAWLASVTQEPSWFTGRLQGLADDVVRHPDLVEGLRAGVVSTRQARVVVDAVDALGHDIDPGLRQRALHHLMGEAQQFNPAELKRLGDGVLQFLAPELADEHERRKLEDEQDRARLATKLKLTPTGEGSSRVSGMVPDHVAARLKTYLSAFSAPRHDAATGGTVEDSRFLDPVTGKRLKSERVLGEAFCAFLEAADPDRLPAQGVRRPAWW